METPAKINIELFASIRILLGMASIIMMPPVAFFITWWSSLSYEWYKECANYRLLLILVDLMSAACVITAMISMRKEPELRQVKTAVIIACLVFFFVFTCTFGIFIN